MKECLCCMAVADDGATTCAFCGEGSWSLSAVMADDAEKPADDAEKPAARNKKGKA